MKTRNDNVKPKAYRQLTSLKLHPFTMRLLDGVQRLTRERNRTKLIEKAIWLAYWQEHLLEPKVDELLRRANVAREKTDIQAELDRELAKLYNKGVSFFDFLEKLGLDKGMAEGSRQFQKTLRRSVASTRKRNKKQGAK